MARFGSKIPSVVMLELDHIAVENSVITEATKSGAA